MDNTEDTENIEQQLFKFKSQTVNMKFNKLPEKLKKKYERNTKILTKLNIKEDTQMVAEINCMIKDISMDMVSFIINECGYMTANKEYKNTLLKTVNEFVDIHQIK